MLCRRYTSTSLLSVSKFACPPVLPGCELSHSLLLTAEEHCSLSARRTVAGPPSGCTFGRTGRATPKRTAVHSCTVVLWAAAGTVMKRDCCTQLHVCTVGSSHCNVTLKGRNFRFLKQRKSSFASDWLITPYIARQQENLDVSHWMMLYGGASDDMLIWKMTWIFTSL